MFSSAAWRKLAAEHPDVSLLRDIWDVARNCPRANLCQDDTSVQAAIRSLVSKLPVTRKSLLNGPRSDTEGVGTFCGVGVMTDSKTEEIVDLGSASYKTIYRARVAIRTASVDLGSRVQDICSMASLTLGRQVHPPEIFRACRNRWLLPKQRDFLWRLALDKVRMGPDFPDPPAESCPLDGSPYTVIHCFVECRSARAVWAAANLFHERPPRGRT